MTTQTSHRTSQTNAKTNTNTNGHVKMYPAAKQLATKTDLTAQETQAITEALNPLIADAFALDRKSVV